MPLRPPPVTENLLKEGTTRDAIIDRMLSEYEVSRDELSHDVDEILDKLRRIGGHNPHSPYPCIQKKTRMSYIIGEL